jgi:hypothetical protein
VAREAAKRTGKRLSATYVDEYTAIFYGTKRMELNHRDSVEMLREEDAQGAPPRFSVTTPLVSEDPNKVKGSQVRILSARPERQGSL